MTKFLTVGVCGQVSCGKSSWVDGFIGAFACATSLSRETCGAESFTLHWLNNHWKPEYSGNIHRLEQTMLAIKELNKTNKNSNTVAVDITDRTSGNQSIDGTASDMKIPCHYGFDVKIIDFPGINDSADADGKFFKVLTANIDKCDILIYLTNAETAFTLTSEVDVFKKIEALVNATYAKGKYIKLIIAVNKYDNESKELKTIFNESKLKHDHIKSYRVSSHKLFINTLKIGKVSRDIPTEHMTEFLKILKNANVNVGPIKQAIKNKMLIDFSKITYNENIDDLFTDTGDNNNDNTGDLDDMICSLQDEHKNLKDNQFQCGIDYINKNMANNWVCIETYKKIGSTEYEKTKQQIIIDIFTKYYEVCNPKTNFINVFDVVQTEFIKSILINHCFEQWDTDLCALLFYRFTDEIKNKEWIIKLLALPTVWAPTFNIRYTKPDSALVILDNAIIDKMKTNPYKMNWFINNIYYSGNDLINYLVDIASLNYHNLIYQINGKKINIDTCGKLSLDLFISLKIRLKDFKIFSLDENCVENTSYQTINTSALKHRMFISIKHLLDQ